MSIMSPERTEKDDEENQTASLTSSPPSSSKKDITINGSNGVTSGVTAEVGAKRRKPLKTNKVTQQLQVIQYSICNAISIHH